MKPIRSYEDSQHTTHAYLSETSLAQHIADSECLVPDPELRARLDEGEGAGQVQVAGVLARMLRQLLQQAQVRSWLIRLLRSDKK